MSRGPRRNRVRRHLTTLLALVAVVALPLPAFAEETVTSVKASSFGASANVDLNNSSVSVGPSPSASVPSSGGSDSDSAANVDLGVGLGLVSLKVVDTGVLDVSAGGSQVGTAKGQASSQASVSNVNLIAASTSLLPGLLPAVVHADTVTATCSAAAEGVSGSTQLIGASVSGVGTLNVSPSPNTKVSIPDVGTLWLNRQTTDSSGNLTVTGMQLALNLDLTLALGLGSLDVNGSGTINIARAVCGVNTQQVVTTTSTTSATTTSTASSATSTSVGGATSTSTGGTTGSTAESATTSTTADNSSTTTVDGATTTSLGDDATTTTTDEDWCTTDEGNDQNLVALASNSSGTGFGALRIGGSALAGDGGPLPVILSILILLVAAALGAVGGYAIHKFGLFDRMARLKGAGL